MSVTRVAERCSWPVRLTARFGMPFYGDVGSPRGEIVSSVDGGEAVWGRASAAGGPHAPTARDLVIGYIDALNAVGEAMRVAIPPLEQLADVLGLVRSHRISRNGEIGTYSYRVHGAGFLFTSHNGTEIDVDFAADGTEIFDLWRLRCYGRSWPQSHNPTDGPAVRSGVAEAPAGRRAPGVVQRGRSQGFSMRPACRVAVGGPDEQSPRGVR
ncbi:DUF6896 domain-containing protein [Streptomyces sp. NPDC057909]|uniref:DUF6896 domain-containing protein n=1 Tax=Streptomyces sp. NPDC057909 TaxID=3346277 RepID=UPI0036E88C94